MKETELAAATVKFLESQGWEVFEEVSLGYSRDRADIVARRDNVIMVVECKVTLGLDVLAQAHAWRVYADMVAVAVPRAKNSRARQFARHICERDGMGLLEYRGGAFHPVADARPGSPNDACRRTLASLLTSRLKGFTKAGGNRGGHWTEFAQTCLDLRDVVLRAPGITIDDAVKAIQHHYASDKSAKHALMTMIKKRIIPGFALAKRGNSWVLKASEVTR